MNTIIDQYFKTSEGKRVGGMRRTLKIDFIPILNASIEDFVWRKEKKINDIIINPMGNYYMLKVDDEIVDSIESFNEIAKAYERNEWVKI